ncbi:TerB family tellurite resistance protein [Rhodoblastus acidophilus]|uniref:TerB family tellurite resistance protein n=1 Tax=Candidatus Rhodoblastus alkanivorans TaxID=2954117 RepID=A0ABS9Z381_9HYPH|nr:TerB family tellurite resistance protein [Candidatus Rhodoblastus alkanivorans]MCI4677541.1 TerB family tellurite resistance protein [Candidatus Rhodoblastus alkanivorans]MCI4681900.1 TerB family tellurite resistance protein [Candidatus Rhodoblastus alkanivorans]MDI4642950.1 TerB family tellurite resistance protein [Rhodoblastus acidophilus]
MFERLRRFIDDLTGSEPVERDFGESELRVAAAALLVHVAEIDGFFTDSEKRALLLLLQQRFGLDVDSAERLLAEARERDRESVDLYGFTSVLKHSMSGPDRRRLVEMMWNIAYADGAVQEFEENIIWRVSELLNVPSCERLAMRRKVREEQGCDPDAPGPWDLDAPATAEVKP